MKIAILGYGVVGSGTYDVLTASGYDVKKVLDIKKNDKLTLVGVEVKSSGKNILINNIKTVFASKIDNREEILLDQREKNKHSTVMSDEDQSSTYPENATITLPQSDEKSSLDDIKTKYQSSKFVSGDEDEIILPDGSTVSGTWKIVEATAPSASHDEQTFHKTNGFPTNTDGSTINDRDYEHDTQAQEMVHKIASD